MKGSSSSSLIDGVTAARAVSTNTYQATGLNAGTEYVFEVTSQTDYIESSTTGLLAASTPFETPTLDVEGTGAVVEGQPYEIDVTADYPDGEPGAVNYYTVNWSDGYTGNYYYPPGSDPTQPLAITHTFNADCASPTVTVTAVDSAHGSWTADPQSVAVTPVAPTLSSVTASANSITVHWSNTSSISTGTTILLSTDGTNYFEYGDAAAGATSLTIANLSLDTHYWVETLTDSVNGISTASSSLTASTPYVAPTLNVSAPNPAIAGEPYVLNLSATYADGTPLADQVDHWLVNYGDGNGTQTYSTGAIQSPTTNSAGGTHTITVIAVDGNGNQITYPSQTVTYSTPDNGQTVTNYGDPILISGAVDVGGTAWYQVSDGGGAGLAPSFTSTNTNVATTGNVIDLGSGNYKVLVTGVSYGQTNIIIRDSQGNVGQSGLFWTNPQAVTTRPANSIEIEGGYYDSTDMPGFDFHLSYPSASDVTVHFNTSGSTLPGSMLGWLNSGSVVIPAGVTDQFFPYTVEEDGKIAPTRGAVVNIEMPGDTEQTSELTAVMLVTNSDTPTVTMGAASAGAAGLKPDNAVIPLDPQGDSSKLTDIHMDATKVDGAIWTSTLIWNPDDFVMWPSDTIGAAGDDLTNPEFIAGNLGPDFNEITGDESFTFGGAPPTDIYGQCISGSTNWDTTGVELVVNLVKPKTNKVPAETGTADAVANGTANGVELEWENKVVTGVNAGNVVIGQGIQLSAEWVGPSDDPTAAGSVDWVVAPKAVSSYTLSLQAGTVEYLASSVSDEASAGHIPTIHFYWVDPALPGTANIRKVEVAGLIQGMSVDVSTKFTVWTPGSSLTDVPTSNDPKIDFGESHFPGFQGVPTLHYGTNDSPGSNFNASVTAPSFIGGKSFYLQLVQNSTQVRFPGGIYTKNTEKFVLDNNIEYASNPLDSGNYSYDTPVIIPDGETKIVGPTNDSPLVAPFLVRSTATSVQRTFSAKMYLMWQPDGNDSIPVALEVLRWGFSGGASSISVDNTKYTLSPHFIYWDPQGKPADSLPTWTDYYTHFQFVFGTGD